jgi:hypothetical protein
LSTLFVSENDARERTQLLTSTPTDYDALRPGGFEGVFSGAGQGISRALASTYAVTTDLQRYQPAGLALKTWDAAAGTHLEADAFDRSDALARDWLDASRLDPVTHGAVANILYGVGSQAPAILASAFGGPVAGAAVAGATNYEGSFSDLSSAGVDVGTARGAAGVDAAFAALGALLPGSIGAKKALNTLLVGPGINLAQDIASRYAVGATLQANGYGELAAQYQHMDATTLIADALVGGAFGHLGAKVSRDHLDAALVQQQIRARLVSDLGAPVDVESQAKHTAALAKAMDDLANNRPVDVSGIEGARFLRDPEGALSRVLAQNGYHAEVAQLHALQAELDARGIAVPDESEPLPVVPKPRVRIQPDGTMVTADTAHEAGTLSAAQAVAEESNHTIPTPDGEVRAKTALARADREVATAEAESVQFAAAVECAMRHGP